jgi:hypothetical protein
VAAVDAWTRAPDNDVMGPETAAGRVARLDAGTPAALRGAMTFRATLLELVLIAGGAAPLAGCPMPPGGCPDTEHGATDLDEPEDDELQALIDACRDAGGWDLAACEPMCRELVERATGGPPAEELSECYLGERTDAEGVTATAHWTIGPLCIGGRRPGGYRRSRHDVTTPGGFFAEQARLEAASVTAFVDLARALEAHHAPRLLVAAARRAAVDEVVHAVLTARIARRFGATPGLRLRRAAPVPDLEELARDNAVEGCVRETWAALVATWQAQAAADPEIRAAMRRVAPDESRHATLSRAIHRWAMRRLDAAARARVQAARAAAIEELAATVGAAVPAELAAAAGLPVGGTATRLFAGLAATAWA